MHCPYLYGANFSIFLVDCELTEELLIAGASRFSAGLEPGIYDLGDNAIKPTCAVEVTEDFLSNQNFVSDEPTKFKVVKLYE